MRFSITTSGNLKDLARDELPLARRAVTGAMELVGNTLKANWRAQIVGAGLGRDLGNTVRSQIYPKGRDSLNAAALVWSNAGKIVRSFDKGAVIRSKDGFWLAIPLPAAGKSPRGKKKITPGEWERRTGRVLRFVYRPGRSALLVDDGKRKRGARLITLAGNKVLPRGFRNRTIPIFALVPQVTLRKRLDLIGAADRLAASLGARIVAGWR